jgi:hypothetical protein
VTGLFFTSTEDKPHLEALQQKLDAVAGVDGAAVAVTVEEMAAYRNSVPVPDQMDRGDIEMLFRCMMQMARHLAKKYGFTIKQWPEN